MNEEADMHVGRELMRTLAVAGVVAIVVWSAGPAIAADDTKVKEGTGAVESGAKEIGAGKVGQGVGKTVVEGAKSTGEKFKESGKAAEPEAKSAWENTKSGAVAFGHSVKNFFQNLFK